MGYGRDMSYQGKEKSNRGLNDELSKRIMGYILAGFGLVAGLAWNEAIKELIAYLFPMSKDTMLAKFVYAIILTLILVLVTIYLARLFKKEESK